MELNMSKIQIFSILDQNCQIFSLSLMLSPFSVSLDNKNNLSYCYNGVISFRR